MIRRLYVNNFRCLVNFELRLPPLCLIAGPNGSGKSSVIDVLFLLRRFIAGEEGTENSFEHKEKTDWIDSNNQGFELEVEADSGVYLYKLVIEFDAEKQPSVTTETLDFNRRPLFLLGTENPAVLYREDGSEFSFPVDRRRSGVASAANMPDAGPLASFRKHIENTIAVGFDPFDIRSDDHWDKAPMRLMQNFARVYRSFLQENPTGAFEATRELRKVVEDFDTFRLAPHGGDFNLLHVVFKNTASRGKRIEIPFHRLSEGQKMLCVLYTLLYGSRGADRSLFLDEPDNFLALREIQPWLVQAADFAGSEIPQIVLVSHHPEIIDYLGESKLRMLTRKRNGSIRVKTEFDFGGSPLKLSEIVARGWDE